MSSSLTILDVAIGLSFVYLLLSLICSVINEWISAVFRRRQRNLVYGITNLLNENVDYVPILAWILPPLRAIGGFVVGLFTKPKPLTYADKGKNPVVLPLSVSTYTSIGGTNFKLPVSDALGNVLIDHNGTLKADKNGNPVNPAGIALVDGSDKKVALPISNPSGSPTDAEGKSLTFPVKDAAGHVLFDGSGKLLAFDADRKPVDWTLVPTPPLAVTLSAKDAKGSEVTLPVKNQYGKVVIDEIGNRVVTGDTLLAHPLIRSYYQGERAPSYLPANAFALALFDLLGASDETLPESFDQLRTAANKLPETMRGALMPLIESAAGDFQRARKHVENWYNEGMDRVTGIYKRWNMLILFVIGAVLAIAMNADTFGIARTLWRNPAVREAAIASAQQQIQAGNTPQTQPSAASQPSDPDPHTSQINGIVQQLDGINLLTTWDSDWARAPKSAGAQHAQAGWWATKILGLLFTAAAISLGAPFWFDTLNRFINLRASVKTDDDTDNKAVRRKQPPPASASGSPGGAEK